MIRKLSIVAVSGLVIAIVALGAAWVVGGGELRNRIRDEGGFGIVINDEQGPETSRTLTLATGQPLVIEVPIALHYTRGPLTQMTLAGPAGAVNALKWEGNRLTAGNTLSLVDNDITLTIAAPELPPLTIRKAGDVDLKGLSQRELVINATGAVNVDADGKVDTLKVTASGAGNIDAERVDAKDATVSIAGVGNIDIAATGKVDAAISGAGNITLHRKPAMLSSRISGIGSVDHAY